MWTDFRLKILRLLRKNKLIIFILLCVFAIILIINLLLKGYKKIEEPQTTYEPHVSIMDDDKVPTKVANEIEEMIEEYMNYCNDSDWLSAYKMLSDECKEIEFENDLTNYMKYAYEKMPTPKSYAIQDYSNDGDTYIYQIKYTDDILATGLTNSTYSFTEEKMIFKKTKKGIEMSVGNFVDYSTIENVYENEYMKIEAIDVTAYYSVEKYKVKITNRSNYTIVIMNGQETDEIALKLESGNTRTLDSSGTEIVLEPQESVCGYLTFSKFYDNDNDATGIIFNSVRVMEKYSGITEVTQEIINEETENALAKFSITLDVSHKK